MVGGGEDAGIKHIGAAIKAGVTAEKISDVGGHSLLSCIATKLPILAATREPYAFEEDFEAADGPSRCWVTLLPFSASGTWVDYVYGYATVARLSAEGEEPVPDTVDDAEMELTDAGEPEEVASEAEVEDELVLDQPMETGSSAEQADAETESTVDEEFPGFSARFSKKLKSVAGFYGRVPDLELGKWDVEDVDAEAAAEDESEAAVENEPALADEPVAEEAVAAGNEGEEEMDESVWPIEGAESAGEEMGAVAAAGGALQGRLDDARAKADEARLAKLRSNVALYEGLSAAYDFALDAEEQPEDYLKIVEAQGLKIQLRAPMAPVVRLAFDGMCDDATIAQLESILAWALKQDLPRGSLAERIQAEGGIAAILAGLGKKG